MPSSSRILTPEATAQHTELEQCRSPKKIRCLPDKINLSANISPEKKNNLEQNKK